MKLKIISSANKEFEKVREHINTAYSKRYIGWNSDIDKMFDPQTVCFYILEGSEIMATSRLVFNRHNGKDLLSPDIGTITNWNYSKDEIDCEGTGLTFKFGYLQPLMLSMFEWLNSQNVSNCLSLFDPENTQVANYNIRILNFQPLQSATICFPEFMKEDRNQKIQKSVVWNVGIQNPKDREKCVDTLKGRVLKSDHIGSFKKLLTE